MEILLLRLATNFGIWFSDIWDAHKWTMEEAWLRYVMEEKFGKRHGTVRIGMTKKSLSETARSGH